MKKFLSATIAILIVITAALASSAGDTAAYLTRTVTEPTVSSVGGEWTVIALARGGMNTNDDYFQKYYSAVQSYVREKSGVLNTKKHTEYSRVILALTSIGKDAQNICGYDLTAPLLDYDKTVWQGINGAIWALIALDCKNFGTDEIKTAYINHILSRQNADGGWAFSDESEESDADITAMALCALAKHRTKTEVQTAIDSALNFLSRGQCADGGYTAYGAETSESAAQVLTALSALGVSCEDSRFVKNGKTIVDNINSFKNSDGSFSHTDTSNLMATEQCCYALVAADRLKNGKTALFDMSDVTIENMSAQTNPESSVPQIKYPDKTFADIGGHEAQTAIEDLARRGIINGMTDDSFAPNATMKRAEFAAIIVRALSLPLATETQFADVAPDDWYFCYVGAAFRNGIINGVSDTKFDPDGTITNEQAAAMVCRAARLPGLENTLNAESVRNILAEFDDYTSVSGWARDSVAFCYSAGICDRSELNIRPQDAIKRYEVAQMIYNALKLINE